MQKQDSYVGEKFLFGNKEYIRIDGVWFLWEKKEDRFVVVKDDSIEKLYTERYKK